MEAASLWVLRIAVNLRGSRSSQGSPAVQSSCSPHPCIPTVPWVVCRAPFLGTPPLFLVPQSTRQQLPLLQLTVFPLKGQDLGTSRPSYLHFLKGLKWWCLRQNREALKPGRGGRRAHTSSAVSEGAESLLSLPVPA